MKIITLKSSITGLAKLDMTAETEVSACLEKGSKLRIFVDN
jgi:hypothetical protein